MAALVLPFFFESAYIVKKTKVIVGLTFFVCCQGVMAADPIIDTTARTIKSISINSDDASAPIMVEMEPQVSGCLGLIASRSTEQGKALQSMLQGAFYTEKKITMIQYTPAFMVCMLNGLKVSASDN